MKNLFKNVQSVRAVLAFGATLLVLPLSSAFNAAQADPPRWAPAYGQRRRQEARRYIYRLPVYVPAYRRPSTRFGHNRYNRRDDWRNRRDSNWRDHDRRDHDRRDRYDNNQRDNDWRNRNDRRDNDWRDNNRR